MRGGLVLAGLLLSACTAVQTAPPLAKKDGMPVYIIDHGYHAGIAIRVVDIPGDMIPEREDYPGVDYLEFGWGDWDYYQTGDPGLWLTLKAALWPTRAVLHVAGTFGSPEAYFAGADILRLRLRPQAFRRLIGFIHHYFDRRGRARAEPLRTGYYPVSHFYPARGKFHIFYTCNGWVADALERAGLSLGWPRPITADQLMVRLRRLLRQVETRQRVHRTSLELAFARSTKEESIWRQNEIASCAG